MYYNFLCTDSMIPVMKLNAKIYDPRVLQYEFDIINDAVQGNCKHSSLILVTSVVPNAVIVQLNMNVKKSQQLCSHVK